MSNLAEQDVLLQQLIQQAIAHNPESPERAKAIESLVALTHYLPGSLTQQRLDTGLRPYYDDALRRTEQGMSRTIDNFPDTYNLDIANPEPRVVRQCFVRWYNLIVKRKCIDMWRFHKRRPKPVELDAPVQGEGGISQEEITENSRILQPMDAAMREELRNYLEQDPIGELRNCCSRIYPNCNCWELVKRRILTDPPERWQDIARVLDIPVGNITSHWHRKCKPLLKNWL